MFELNNKLIIDFPSFFTNLQNNIWEVIALVLDILIVGYLCIKYFLEYFPSYIHFNRRYFVIICP